MTKKNNNKSNQLIEDIIAQLDLQINSLQNQIEEYIDMSFVDEAKEEYFVSSLAKIDSSFMQIKLNNPNSEQKNRAIELYQLFSSMVDDYNKFCGYEDD